MFRIRQIEWKPVYVSIYHTRESPTDVSDCPVSTRCNWAARECPWTEQVKRKEEASETTILQQLKYVGVGVWIHMGCNCNKVSNGKFQLQQTTLMIFNIVPDTLCASREQTFFFAINSLDFSSTPMIPIAKVAMLNVKTCCNYFCVTNTVWSCLCLWFRPEHGGAHMPA